MARPGAQRGQPRLVDEHDDAAYYALNNTIDNSENDGYRMTKVYSSPYDTWESIPEASYVAGNAGDRDRRMSTGTVHAVGNPTRRPSTSAAPPAGNSTPDALDGWRYTKAYSSPYSLWNPPPRRPTPHPRWPTRRPATPMDWDATKVYTAPYTFHENSTSRSTAPTPRSCSSSSLRVAWWRPFPPAVRTPTPTRPRTTSCPQWTQFSGAMTSMALAECGGTVTLQTKIGNAAAPDPFTYFNSVDKTTATTSSQFRSGTFDFDLAGGGSVNTTISLLNSGNLTHYHPVSWSCKSGGADYPFTVTPGAGGWSDINLTVSPNQAISCVQTVSVVMSRRHQPPSSAGTHRVESAGELTSRTARRARSARRRLGADAGTGVHPRRLAVGGAAAVVRAVGDRRRPGAGRQGRARAEATRGNLRTVLADPKALFDACSLSGPTVAVNLAPAQLAIPTTVTCNTLKDQTEMDGAQLRLSMATVQVGSTMPIGTVGNSYAGSGGADPAGVAHRRRRDE